MAPKLKDGPTVIIEQGEQPKRFQRRRRDDQQYDHNYSIFLLRTESL